MKALEKSFPVVTELLHFYEGKGVKAGYEKTSVFFYLRSIAPDDVDFL